MVKITGDKTRRDGSALPPQAALGYSDKRWIVTRLGGTRTRKKRRRSEVSDLALFLEKFPAVAMGGRPLEEWR